jgi:hypothetical protein
MIMYPHHHDRKPTSPGQNLSNLDTSNGRGSADRNRHFPTTQTAKTQAFRLYSDEELQSYEPPPFAVDGIYHEGAFIVLVGPSGGGKSFLALDLALCHATGLPWHGRSVQHGPVVYVAAEGRAGLGTRIEGWKTWHGWVGPAGLHTILEPTLLNDSTELDRLLHTLNILKKKSERPALVIVDTLARNLGDADENSARDMSRFVQGVDTIRRETRAATMVVHHTGLKSGRERGSTALRGAADTTLLLRGTTSGHVTLQCLKQKEAVAFSPLHFQLEASAHSCVLVPATPATNSLTGNENVALEYLAGCGSGGTTYTAWLRGSGLVGGAFDRAVKALLDAGLVGGGGGKGVPYVALDPAASNAAAAGNTQPPR